MFMQKVLTEMNLLIESLIIWNPESVDEREICPGQSKLVTDSQS